MNISHISHNTLNHRCTIYTNIKYIHQYCLVLGEHTNSIISLNSHSISYEMIVVFSCLSINPYHIPVSIAHVGWLMSSKWDRPTWRKVYDVFQLFDPPPLERDDKWWCLYPKQYSKVGKFLGTFFCWGYSQWFLFVIIKVACVSRSFAFRYKWCFHLKTINKVL